MEEQIIKLIEDITHYNGINNSIDLIEEDILDSLAFIELIGQLNNTFNIEIQPTQVSGNTWRTVDGISKMVKSLVDNT